MIDDALQDTYMRIDSAVIAANLEALRRRTGSRIIAVLKNNGYGLSLVDYAQLLHSLGIDFFAVGSAQEALCLRQNGIEADVLVLTPETSCTRLAELATQQITLTIGSLEQAQAVLSLAHGGEPPPVHVMIDTGMGRYGFTGRELSESIDVLKALRITGVYTHFSSPYRKPGVTARQYHDFLLAIKIFRANGVVPGMLHCCASGAMLRHPAMHLDAVRIGSALLGRVPRAQAYALRDAVCLVAPVVETRRITGRCRMGYNGGIRIKSPTKIGIVNAGVVHGYAWQKRFFGLLPAKQYAVVDDRRVPILGPLGANALALDLTDVACDGSAAVRLPVNPIYCTQNIDRRFV